MGGGQDGFMFLEKMAHESTLARLERDRSLVLTGEERALVFEAMAAAARIARAAGAVPRANSRPKPVVKKEEDVSDVVMTMPMRGGGTWEVRQSVLDKLKEAYPLVDTIARMREILIEWDADPSYRPQSNGYKAVLHWFKSAQLQAERRTNGSGGSKPWEVAPRPLPPRLK